MQKLRLAARSQSWIPPICLAHDPLGLQEVARTAAQLGWAGVHVLPLAEAGKAPGARRAAANTDPQQLVAQLQQLLAQNGGVHTQQTPLLLACLQVGAPTVIQSTWAAA